MSEKDDNVSFPTDVLPKSNFPEDWAKTCAATASGKKFQQVAVVTPCPRPNKTPLIPKNPPQLRSHYARIRDDFNSMVD